MNKLIKQRKSLC